MVNHTANEILAGGYQGAIKMIAAVLKLVRNQVLLEVWLDAQQSQLVDHEQPPIVCQIFTVYLQVNGRFPLQ